MPDASSSTPEDDMHALLAARCGKTLDQKWTLGRLLGVGGMSAVYEAHHRNGRRVALKVLHPTLAVLPSARARFLREGFLANRAAHPGLVQVLDEGSTDDGEIYLVMEYLEGETLEQRVSRAGVLPVDEALRIASSLLDALATAHTAGLVHRDIKPANVMLLPDGGVKLLDFGIARLTESGTATQHGSTRGTPAFMAPEQARGETDAIGPRTDLWAVGALLFYLLSGRQVREATNTEALIFEAATRPARSLGRLVPSLPAAVVALVDRALAFDPAARFADAVAMRAAVDALAGHPPSNHIASPSSAPGRSSSSPFVPVLLSATSATASPLPQPTQATTETPAHIPPPRSRPYLARTAALLALALALPLSWRAWLRFSPAPVASVPALASTAIPSWAPPGPPSVLEAPTSPALSASGPTARPELTAALPAPVSLRGPVSRDARPAAPPRASTAAAPSASPTAAPAEGAPPLTIEKALEQRR